MTIEVYLSHKNIILCLRHFWTSIQGILRDVLKKSGRLSARRPSQTVWSGKKNCHPRTIFKTFLMWACFWHSLKMGVAHPSDKICSGSAVLLLVCLLSAWVPGRVGGAHGKSKMYKIWKLDIACDHLARRRRTSPGPKM